MREYKICRFLSVAAPKKKSLPHFLVGVLLHAVLYKHIVRVERKVTYLQSPWLDVRTGGMKTPLVIYVRHLGAACCKPQQGPL